MSEPETGRTADLAAPPPHLEAAAASESVADGVERHIDPRAIPLHRIVAAIVTSAITFGHAIAVLIVIASGDVPRWLVGLLLIAFVGVTASFAWLVIAWPPLHYRHTAYRVTERGITIRTGVVWRSITTVPRSRIQHIDVAQGPIQRQLGLAKLVLHTAGTENAQVQLDGLSHPTALRIRDHLVSGGPDDAL